MTYSRDMQTELDPITDLFRTTCQKCGKVIEYEDYRGTPLRSECSLCEFKSTHSKGEVSELSEIMTHIRSTRVSSYLLVEDAIYFWKYWKIHPEDIK